MDANKDVRKSLDKMRRNLGGGESFAEQAVNENNPPLLDMREMMKRARKMNEFKDAPGSDMLNPSGVEDKGDTSDNDTIEFNIEDMTSTDKETQKEKIQNAFENQDVYVEITDFKQYNDSEGKPLAFFLTGGIDGVITFTLKVGKTEEISGVDWTATPEFSDDQRNEDIVERLTDYYKEFYEEWRESLY